MTVRPVVAERDPLPDPVWVPVSHEYRRREALEACRQAVAKSKGVDKPAGEAE